MMSIHRTTQPAKATLVCPAGLQIGFPPTRADASDGQSDLSFPHVECESEWFLITSTAWGMETASKTRKPRQTSKSRKNRTTHNSQRSRSTNTTTHATLTLHQAHRLRSGCLPESKYRSCISGVVVGGSSW